MSDWANEMEEVEELKCQMPRSVSEFDKEKGIRRDITYQRDEAGNLHKVISELRIEVRKVSKNIARRKEWKKYGAAESDGRGPNPSNTYPAEEVYLQYVSGRNEDDPEKPGEDPGSKLPKNIATCRICKGAHFTHRCPFKDSQDVLAEAAGLGSSRDAGDASTGGGKSGGGGSGGGGGGGNQQVSIPKEPGGKYIPPGLRQAAAGGSSASSMALTDKQRRDDQPTIRVTNLPEDTTEEDLSNLFNPFGKIHRIFLAKDKLTMASKGFAFITYQKKEDAQKAIAGVSGYGYGHLILKVEWAKPANE